MTDDASLTDFADDEPDEDESAAGADDEPDATADAPDPARPDDTPDPATATYRWSPDGASCPDCGDSVERRWRDGDRLVCVDCKDW